MVWLFIQRFFLLVRSYSLHACCSCLWLQVPNRIKDCIIIHTYIHKSACNLCSGGVHLCPVTSVHEGTAFGMLVLHWRTCNDARIIAVLVTVQGNTVVLAILQSYQRRYLWWIAVTWCRILSVCLCHYCSDNTFRNSFVRLFC